MVCLTRILNAVLCVTSWYEGFLLFISFTWLALFDILETGTQRSMPLTLLLENYIKSLCRNSGLMTFYLQILKILFFLCTFLGAEPAYVCLF